MTAHALQEDKERCIAAGMDDYITKPLNPAKLLSSIKHNIANRNPKESDKSEKGGTNDKHLQA